jgi:hypothetical protein
LPRLVAVKRLSYAGKRLKAGDEFDARDADAKILGIIGSARYATREMKAGTLSLPPKAPPPAEKFPRGKMATPGAKLPAKSEATLKAPPAEKAK